ncbi:MAG: HmuY family protein [Flectobacillus sp.]|uniref:HmuY family protein n=1 Tax=Flectobacillus sp. TaxID=50419 RepID=UPI003B9D17AD
MKYFSQLVGALLLGGALVVSSCKDTEIALPDNLAQFEATQQGIDAATTESVIKVKLSRAVESTTSVTLQLTATGLTYGTEFSTEPAASNNQITLQVPAGSSETSFKLTKKAGIFLSGSESLAVKITSTTNSVLVGTNAELTVKFTAIVSEGSTLKLNGGTGGSSAVNSVWVDFSNNSQTAVARAAWDLGFYTGSSFVVKINNLTAATAIVTTKTDINQVSAADTVGKNLTLGFETAHFALVDDVTGDISKTVIAAVSATDADNKVYILNRGTGGATAKKDLMKLRVLRNTSGGYTLQYAKLNETSYQTMTIAKDASLQFVYTSFDSTSPVSVEPAKEKWDIQWTGALYKTALSATADIPYYFSDQVFINHLAGVQAAEVLTSTVSYDAFAESNISSITFGNNRSVIGANWRATTGTVGVKTDRFYVVKDASGNVYKLKFLNFTSADGGERGYPNIEYKLVKKAQ